MKILFLDIENTANVAHVWSLWQENVQLVRLIKPSYMLCFALSWGDGKVGWFKADEDGMKRLWQAMHEADVVVTYNGKKHDIPHIQRTFLEMGMPPPSPFKHVDLYETVRRQFKFPSNKLEYVVQALKIGKKGNDGGYATWLGCMEGDESAWKKMEKYNKMDVTILRKLYKKVLPWIKNHPNLSVLTHLTVCPSCGSKKLQSRGTAVTAALSYQRYHCQSCGAWSRGARGDHSQTISERRRPL